MRRLTGATLALVWLLAAAPLYATPGHSYGFGSRPSALGGAVSSGDGDAASIFYNPASLALAPHSQLLLGYRGASSSLQTNQHDAGIPGYATLDGAALGRGEFWGVPVGFGLGLALTNGHLSRVRTVRADQPHWVLRETLPELLDLSTALALRPLPWLALGGGAGFLATTRGGFMVEGSALLSDGMGAEYDSKLRHSVDAELISVRYLLLGAELLLPRSAAPFGESIDWRVGLAFRDEAKLEQALRGTLHGAVDAGFFQVPVRYTFDAQSLVAFQPRQLLLGLAAQHRATRAELDLAWEQWSRYPSPVSRSAAHIEADVPAGLPLELPENQELAPATLSGFEDRFTLRAGIEHWLELTAASRLALRAGYAYLPTPAPRSAEVGQLLDADEHVFSLGSGLAMQTSARYLPRGIALDVHGLWSRLPNYRQQRGDRLFMAKGNVVAAGASLTFSFARGGG